MPKFELDDQDQTAWLATDKGTGFLSSCVIDEFIFYSRAVTAKEVDEISKKGIVGCLECRRCWEVADHLGRTQKITAEISVILAFSAINIDKQRI